MSKKAIVVKSSNLSSQIHGSCAATTLEPYFDVPVQQAPGSQNGNV